MQESNKKDSENIDKKDFDRVNLDAIFTNFDESYMEPRLRIGMYRTPEEKEKYINNALKRKLP